MTLRRKSEIKIYRLNVPSILSKRKQLRTLVHDLGSNYIRCLTKTWLCEFDYINIFKPDKKKYFCFTTDRISPAVMKTKKIGGVMMLVPNIFF